MTALAAFDACADTPRSADGFRRGVFAIWRVDLVPHLVHSAKLHCLHACCVDLRVTCVVHSVQVNALRT